MIKRSVKPSIWIWSILALLCLPARAQESAPADSAQQGQAASQTAPPESDAGVIDESQRVGLPLNGRSYSQLATLEGGVSDPFGGGKQGGGSGGLTVSGGRGEWTFSSMKDFLTLEKAKFENHLAEFRA